MNDTKKDIIKRTLSLVIERGLKTSMDEIAQSLCVSKRTIYEHFENKDDLIYHCIDSMIEEGFEGINEMLLKTSNPIEELFPILHENVRQIYGHRFKILDELKRIYPAIHEACLVKHKEQYYSRLKDVISRGKKEGLFRKDIHEEIIIFYMPIISTALSSQKITLSENYSMKDVFSNIMVPFMRGMLTEKGVVIFDKIITKFKKYTPELQ
ncbi:MAG: TetR/AcrR family transcriptional regulator [Bacteroidales bacterium]|nr:TetR/AcrR family transcriptional regulator [Bacteroidales bacterium]